MIQSSFKSNLLRNPHFNTVRGTRYEFVKLFKDLKSAQNSNQIFAVEFYSLMAVKIEPGFWRAKLG